MIITLHSDLATSLSVKGSLKRGLDMCDPFTGYCFYRKVPEVLSPNSFFYKLYEVTC